MANKVSKVKDKDPEGAGTEIGAEVNEDGADEDEIVVVEGVVEEGISEV